MDLPTHTNKPERTFDKRRGFFRVNHDLIEQLQSQPEGPAIIAALFNGMLILRCESRFDERTLHYYGQSIHWMEIEPNIRPPEYTAKIVRFTSTDDGSIAAFTVTWSQIDPSELVAVRIGDIKFED